MAKKHRHWSQLTESGTVLGIKFLLLIYRVFGRWGFRVFLGPVITYYYWTQPTARQASIDYLQRLQAFSQHKNQAKLSSFKHFLMFGEVLLDKFLVWTNRIGVDDVVFETPTVFDEMNVGRKGGIIIVSHLGNMEVCSALVQQFPDLELTILAFTQHAVKFNKMMKSASENQRIESLQVTEMTPEVAMRLSDRIDNGGFIIIAGDRTPVTSDRRVSDVSFLGDTAAMPQGGFILAALLKCPVYFMFCLKGKTRYHIYLERFADLLSLPRKSRESAITAAVQQYAYRLQHYCLTAPLQWFNFYSFWKQK